MGPEPFLQTAGKGAGCDISMLRNLPLKKWTDYPRCVIAARDETIAEHPDLACDFVRLMAGAGQWCNEDTQRAGILGSLIGLPEEIGRIPTCVFCKALPRAGRTALTAI